ncbi:hypothetical protein EYF80_013028 [Liparis tanakae]|uniref:Uncharacterized protein n=1 Tax=Liparis tanakae TaxID=230148 RepID=A0A4Z2IFF9_9TELE|nr:hypothetical protein EYF80_013028 [Liparis tanakae]
MLSYETALKKGPVLSAATFINGNLGESAVQKTAARDPSGGNEEGLMVTSCIAHTAPEAADSGFLWLSVSH